jgi:hypothetical protein
LLKVALKHQQQKIKSKSLTFFWLPLWYQQTFLLAIVLSVLLRFTAFDYPCGINKLFLGTVNHNNKPSQWPKEKLVDTKGVIRSRKSKKDRKHNGQKKKNKRTNNDLQNIT